MSELVRMSISLEQPLYDRLEKLVEEGQYANRSEFVRDLIRGRLVDTRWRGNKEAIGTITLVFDHHKRQLSDRLTELQHQFHKEILVSTHIHLDRHMCAEAIIVKGKPRNIEKLANLLQREKGVLHASLAIGPIGGDMA
jgi:CopG family nickel-responsive transcriptional regulator